MAQTKVLSVGIRSTANLGDVAISEMILKLLNSRGYLVERMEFNFSAVVAACFGYGSNLASNSGHFRRIKSERGACFGQRLLMVFVKALKLFFYLPVVFSVFLWKVKKCTKVFIGGGNLLMGIEYGFPLQVLSYVLFSRLLGKKVVFVCVGAGPFTAPGVKPLLRLALRLSQLVICRDTKSRELIESELGGTLVAMEVLPDPVLLWPKVKEISSMRCDIMFTFLPLFSSAIFPDGNTARAENFKSSVVDLLIDLVNLGKRLAILVTDSRVDLDISIDVADEVYRRTSVNLEVKVPVSPEEMAGLMSSAGMVFSTRMHGAIMALSQAVPPLCVNWQPKIKGLYADLEIDELLLELDEQGRIPIRTALNQILEISENLDHYSTTISEKTSALSGQYQHLLAGF